MDETLKQYFAEIAELRAVSVMSTIEYPNGGLKTVYSNEAEIDAVYAKIAEYTGGNQ